MIDKIAPVTPVQQANIVQRLEAAKHEDAQAEEQKHDSAPNAKPDFSALEKNLHKHFATENQSVLFSVDDDTKKMVIKVINNDTKEVVRQYPAEEMLRISRMVVHAEKERGNITDARI